MNNEHVESMTELAAKAGPPVSISIATIAGYNVSDLVVWATLLYTLLMIGHKLRQIWQDVKGGKEHDRSRPKD